VPVVQGTRGAVAVECGYAKEMVFVPVAGSRWSKRSFSAVQDSGSTRINVAASLQPTINQAFALSIQATRQLPGHHTVALSPQGGLLTLAGSSDPRFALADLEPTSNLPARPVIE